MLHYKRTPDPLLSDTLKAGTKSKHGNIYGKAYCTIYEWIRCYPMHKKSDAQDTLSTIFKHDEFPPKMVVDNPKEQSLGELARKCREPECYLVNNEHFSPWSHIAEGCTQELRSVSSRKITKKGSLKQLLDHCIDMEAFISSQTAHIEFELDGEFPETRMTG